MTVTIDGDIDLLIYWEKKCLQETRSSGFNVRQIGRHPRGAPNHAALSDSHIPSRHIGGGL